MNLLTKFLGSLFMFFGLTGTVFADAARPWQIGFQDPASPIMEGIIDLHNTLLFYITVIVVFVAWMLAKTVIHFHHKKNPVPSKNTHGGALEIIWTVVPSLVLAAIAIPSFGLLYMIDEIVDPAITLKAIGHQWYWSYEYSDYLNAENESINFDSYMVQEDDLKEGQYRLLEVDNRICLPILTNIRVIVSATDVLHSWAVPSLGVKIDAVPGRLNQFGLLIKREGLYYGQCSEICGVNHGFMPIAVEAVSLKDYLSWISTKLEQI
jgi:cytochrome c oxidase subunit 2